MTEAELDRLQALADAATPGPWRVGQQDVHGPYHVWSGRAGEPGRYAGSSRADAAFLAASRAAVPDLIAEVRRLWQRVQDLEERLLTRSMDDEEAREHD